MALLNYANGDKGIALGLLLDRRSFCIQLSSNRVRELGSPINDLLKHKKSSLTLPTEVAYVMIIRRKLTQKALRLESKISNTCGLPIELREQSALKRSEFEKWAHET